MARRCRRAKVWSAPSNSKCARCFAPVNCSQSKRVPARCDPRAGGGWVVDADENAGSGGGDRGVFGFDAAGCTGGGISASDNEPRGGGTSTARAAGVGREKGRGAITGGGISVDGGGTARGGAGWDRSSKSRSRCSNRSFLRSRAKILSSAQIGKTISTSARSRMSRGTMLVGAIARLDWRGENASATLCSMAAARAKEEMGSQVHWALAHPCTRARERGDFLEKVLQVLSSSAVHSLALGATRYGDTPSRTLIVDLRGDHRFEWTVLHIRT